MRELREMRELLDQHTACLSAEEREWVRLAIQREAQSIKLRQAIIEKTLAGLIWAGLSGLAYLAWDGFKHWIGR